jgi:hypothetical protein
MAPIPGTTRPRAKQCAAELAAFPGRLASPYDDDDNERVAPNLQRIPAEGDAAAEEIIALARDGVTADLLGCLVRRDATALVRYGARRVTWALRAHSAALLHDAILAEAVADVIYHGDPRDVMVRLACHYYVAQQLGLVPAEVFDTAVSGLPDNGVRDLFRTIGAREDVTLEAFGWLLVQTDDGPDFEPADPVDPARLRSLVLEAKQRRRSYLEGRFGTEGAEQVERSNRKLFGKEP